MSAEHGGGHFAREGALIPGRNRLGADSDPRVLEEADEFGQIDEGRAHGGPAVEIAEFGKEFLRPEAVGLGGAPFIFQLAMTIFSRTLSFSNNAGEGCGWSVFDADNA